MGKKGGSIKLSKKYGLNPSMTICYFCGKESGIALLGRVRDKGADGKPVRGTDVEAPHTTGCIDRIPCSECQEWMKKGVMFLSVKDGENGNDPYRTGAMCVMKDEAVKRMFKGEMLEQTLKKRMAFVEDIIWDKLGFPRKNINNESV